MVQLRVHAAQAVAQRMHAAKAFLERHGALHAGAHHVESRFPVAAIAGGTLNVRPAARQAVERNAVGWRVKGWRHEGFHAVGYRVHTGGRSQHGRQAQRKRGVEKGGLGHQMPAVKAKLATVVHDHNGTARHLTAGAGGGGHSDQWRHTVGDFGRAAFDGGVGFERTLVGAGNCHALGAIDRAATAQGNQAIAISRFVNDHCRAHGRLGWVGWRLVEHRKRQTWQSSERLVQQASGLHSRVGHDQRAANTCPLAFRLELSQRAEVDQDVGDVENLGHGLPWWGVEEKDMVCSLHRQSHVLSQRH